jgi:hypothetical protein
MERIRERVDGAGLDAFRREAAGFMRGDTDVLAYYGTVASLGLAPLVPDMAALLPDPGKAAALLSVHDAAKTGALDGAASSGADGFPALEGGSGSGRGALEKGPSAGKKGAKKVPKFERLRLTGGNPAATEAWMSTGGGTRAPATRPQNAWTQGQPAVGGGGAAQPRGQWRQQGKLAMEWGGINAAWDKS